MNGNSHGNSNCSSNNSNNGSNKLAGCRPDAQVADGAAGKFRSLVIFDIWRVARASI